MNRVYLKIERGPNPHGGYNSVIRDIGNVDNSTRGVIHAGYSTVSQAAADEELRLSLLDQANVARRGLKLLKSEQVKP